MKEIITSIKENDDDSRNEGFVVTTNLHTYKFLIEGGQQCCEVSGYFSSNDNFKDFIGAELLRVDLVDLDNEKLENVLEKQDLNGLYYMGIQFVNFETNRGQLQFAVYNSHNGNYGHSIWLLKDKEKLLKSSL